MHISHSPHQAPTLPPFQSGRERQRGGVVGWEWREACQSGSHPPKNGSAGFKKQPKTHWRSRPTSLCQVLAAGIETGGDSHREDGVLNPMASVGFPAQRIRREKGENTYQHTSVSVCLLLRLLLIPLWPGAYLFHNPCRGHEALLSWVVPE